MADFFGRIKVDLVDLEQREITLALLGRTNLAFNRIARAQTKAPNLARRDIDIVRTGKIVCLGTAQEAKAVWQNLQHAFAENGMIVFGQLFENGKHQLLFTERAGVFDFEFLGQGKKLRRGFLFEFLKMHMCV